MKIPVKSSLAAIVYGMDKRSYEALRMAFNGPGKGCCSLTSSEAMADIAIINMDSVDADQLLLKIRSEYPQRHTIVLSVSDPLIEDALYVSRPICMNSMIKVIEEVQQLPPLELKPATKTVNSENKTAAITANKNSNEEPSPEIFDQAKRSSHPYSKSARIAKIDFNQPEQRDKYYYDPDSYLQGRVAEAIKQANKKNIAVQVSIKVAGEWKTITILPESKKVLTSINDTWLKQLCTTPACMLEIKVRQHNKKNSLDLEYRVSRKEAGVALEYFLWRIAIWTSQGRVPSKTDLKAPVFLKRWPNMTRLVAPQNAMRIITLLIDQPRELPLISQVLGVPYRDVFALYSAANAIGLAGSSLRNADTLIQPKEPKSHRLHGLLGKILNKIKFQS